MALPENGFRMSGLVCTHLHLQAVQFSLPSTLAMKVCEKPRRICNISDYPLGGAPLRSWIYRATLIQGTQQLFISFLWYWGSWMASLNQTGSQQFSLAVTNPNALLGIGLGLACFLWLLGTLVFFGLPSYYRQAPGQVPTFYLSLFRRRIILVRLVYSFFC